MLDSSTRQCIVTVERPLPTKPPYIGTKRVGGYSVFAEGHEERGRIDLTITG